jgi:histidyl-tRNA synthetase
VVIQKLVDVAESNGFQEICLPIVEKSEIYIEKAGPEILGQMYVFKDKSGRDLCLRPEGTATCQLLARGPLKSQKDVKLFYVVQCFRYERPLVMLCAIVSARAIEKRYYRYPLDGSHSQCIG